MFDTITIVLVLLTLSAVAAAGFAIVSFSKVKKLLSELGMRVLESQDIGKIKEAANKTESFESRVAGYEHKADECKNQLAEHKTKLNELADDLGASEEKMASLEARLNELTTKLESVGKMVSRNEDGLAQTVPNIKALADEIQNIKMFQTATERIHSFIQSAFTDMQVSTSPNDMQTSMPHEEDLGTTPEAAKPEEALHGHEEWREETEEQKMSGSRRWQN